MNTNSRIDDVLIGRYDNRYRGVIYEGHEVIPKQQSCRGIWAPIVIESVPFSFVSIRVHSWFVFSKRSAYLTQKIRTAGMGAGWSHAPLFHPA